MEKTGGHSVSNLKRICTALGLKNQGPKANAVAIELRLRGLDFNNPTFQFTPTAADMELSPVLFAERMEIRLLDDTPDWVLTLTYSIAQLCAKLELLLQWHEQELTAQTAQGL